MNAISWTDLEKKVCRARCERQKIAMPCCDYFGRKAYKPCTHCKRDAESLASEHPSRP